METLVLSIPFFPSDFGEKRGLAKGVAYRWRRSDRVGLVCGSHRPCVWYIPVDLMGALDFDRSTASCRRNAATGVSGFRFFVRHSSCSDFTASRCVRHRLRPAVQIGACMWTSHGVRAPRWERRINILTRATSTSEMTTHESTTPPLTTSTRYTSPSPTPNTARITASSNSSVFVVCRIPANPPLMATIPRRWPTTISQRATPPATPRWIPN